RASRRIAWPAISSRARSDGAPDDDRDRGLIGADCWPAGRWLSWLHRRGRCRRRACRAVVALGRAPADAGLAPGASHLAFRRGSQTVSVLGDLLRAVGGLLAGVAGLVRGLL